MGNQPLNIWAKQTPTKWVGSNKLFGLSIKGVKEKSKILQSNQQQQQQQNSLPEHSYEADWTKSLDIILFVSAQKAKPSNS